MYLAGLPRLVLQIYFIPLNYHIVLCRLDTLILYE
jgi:hypothetical protein